MKISGFTLMEIMIAIAILAVVGALAIPAYNGYIREGRKSECNNEITAIMLAQSQFFLENNSYFQGPDVADVNATFVADKSSKTTYSKTKLIIPICRIMTLCRRKLTT